MSRNDIFSTSFRIQPPPNPPPNPLTPPPSAGSSRPSAGYHTHSNSLPLDPLTDALNSEGSSLLRARTTGQSWLRTRALRQVPPPLQLGSSGLQRNRSVHIADKPYVYVLPDLPDPNPHVRESGSYPLESDDKGRMSVDTLAPELQTPLVSASTLQPVAYLPSSEPGPSRTSSFFDLPSARVDPPAFPLPPVNVSRAALTSSSSDFSSAYSTRSNPSLMEELPWDSRGGGPGVGVGEEGDAELEDVRVRLREEKRFFLGEGRFAKVWVAAYRRSRHGREEEEDAETTPNPETGRRSKWRLCAAKQPLPDAESQLLGRREAFFLRHLRKPNLASISDQVRFAEGRMYVVRLLGVVRSSPTGAVEGRTVHSVPPPLPPSMPPADEDRFRRPSLPHQPSSQLTALAPSSATTPLAQAKPDPFHLAPPTPQSLRHARSVSDTHAAHQQSSLLSPTPHAPRATRSRATSPVRAWLSHLPPSPPSPALLSPEHLTLPTPSPSTAHPLPPHSHEAAHITLLLSYHPSGSLAHLLHTQPRSLTPSLYTSLAHQLALALAYVHSCSVLHTDLKPQNVLLSSHPHPTFPGSLTYSARLADFGSALLLPPYASSPPTDGLGLGTPGYTAPELLLPPGSGSFSYSADVFSLGVVLGVLLLGREPYEGLVGGRGRGGRGRGRMEMMRWARGGGYWAYEEGVRLASVGEEEESALATRERGEGEEEDAPRGPLTRDELGELLREDSLDAFEREQEEEMTYPGGEGETASLSGAHKPGEREPIPLPSPPNSPPRSTPQSQHANALGPAPPSLALPRPALSVAHAHSQPYPDGSPAIFFLGPSPSGERVRAPDELVALVKGMCNPKPEGRPGMEEVVRVLAALREMYTL